MKQVPLGVSVHLCRKFTMYAYAHQLRSNALQHTASHPSVRQPASTLCSQAPTNTLLVEHPQSVATSRNQTHPHENSVRKCTRVCVRVFGPQPTGLWGPLATTMEVGAHSEGWGQTAEHALIDRWVVITVGHCGIERHRQQTLCMFQDKERGGIIVQLSNTKCNPPVACP